MFAVLSIAKFAKGCVVKSERLQKMLSSHQFTARRVESIATELRRAGIIPKAGRGPHAPEITTEQAVALVLAVAGTERVADAAAVAEKLGALVLEQGSEFTLSYLLSSSLETGAIEEIRHVRVNSDYPMAEVTFRDGYSTLYFPSELWATPGFKPESQGQGFVGRIGHIGGGILQQIANEFPTQNQPDAIDGGAA